MRRTQRPTNTDVADAGDAQDATQSQNALSQCVLMLPSSLLPLAFERGQSKLGGATSTRGSQPEGEEDTEGNADSGAGGAGVMHMTSGSSHAASMLAAELVSDVALARLLSNLEQHDAAGAAYSVAATASGTRWCRQPLCIITRRCYNSRWVTPLPQIILAASGGRRCSQCLRWAQGLLPSWRACADVAHRCDGYACVVQ